MKTEYFAAREKNGKFFCMTANFTSCQDTACPFYSTREDQKDSLEKAHARLRAPPRSDQGYIAGKYYGGSMPWG